VGSFINGKGFIQWTGESYAHGTTSTPVDPDIIYRNYFMDASYIVPTANENRPASISALACISY
jgi:hypothetical protein